MAKVKEESKIEEVKDSTETREEPKKTESSKKSFSETIKDLDPNKLKEIHSYILSRMAEKDRTAPEAIMSGVAASMFRISGVAIDGFTTNVNALANSFPKVVAAVRTYNTDVQAVVVAVASAFEVESKK